MSSILKALEKVEQAQNAKRNGPSGLVKSKPRRPGWVLPAGIVAGATVASAITFTAMGGFSKAHRADVRPSAPASAPLTTEVVTTPEVKPEQPAGVARRAEAAPKADAVALPASVHAKPLSAAPSLSKKTAPSVAARKAPVAKAPATGASHALPAKKIVASVKPPAKKAVAVPHQAVNIRNAVSAPPAAAGPVVSPPAVQPAVVQAPVKQIVSAPPVQAATVKSRPEIRVNGIAWQNNSESSEAIINGHMVAQGSTVDGYKVERIFEDKVRLLGKNGTIEVPLGGTE